MNTNTASSTMNDSRRDVYVCDLKLVLLGESSVGKSSIVMRYTTGTFKKCNATIGAAYTTRKIDFRGDDGDFRRVNLEIWDTAGQERYRSLAPMYYRNTDIALVVFDVTKSESLRKAKKWVEELESYVEQDRRDKIRIVLVANKKDLEHGPIESDENFVEVSALTGDGINEMFEKIVHEIPISKFRKPDNAKDNSINLNPQKEGNILYSCNC